MAFEASRRHCIAQHDILDQIYRLYEIDRLLTERNQQSLRSVKQYYVLFTYLNARESCYARTFVGTHSTEFLEFLRKRRSDRRFR